ncbi:hypothetical protein EX30DRAFT_262651 [Ascodesmis nigricans]|uniref:Uncharacterized protein n=1 Tax=Ascodesmis nigricans TaxID=341454 RepID=A0A4S2MXV2_9PEZI|nr:hypothetical protein EX30DRAFT_262651 [Ascodesmis nigricans]
MAKITTTTAVLFALVAGLVKAEPIPQVSPPPTTTFSSDTATVSPSPTSSCVTICADYINECGQMYGGCFPDPACTGGTAWPTFSKPPCTSPTGSPYPTCGFRCVDAVNECGMKYGGCYDSCAGPFPFPAPPCPSFTTTSSTKKPPKHTNTPKPPKTKTPKSQKQCKPKTTKRKTESCTETPTPTTTSSSRCDYSICIDYIDACGQG